MNNNQYRWVSIILSLVMSQAAWSNVDPKQTAAQHYSNQQWSEAIKYYKEVLDKEPQNEQAWYRLAQSHLQLKQGKKAFKANAKLGEAQQVPQSLVHYQKAQALAVMGKKLGMWKSLQQAAQLGYGNLKDLQNNHIWDKFRENESFKQVMTTVDQTSRPCMYGEVYQQFDFWVGEWEVYGNAERTGPLSGRNSITKTEQGCLIMEHWQGASGSTGTSMNYYDGLQQKWVQHWVSSGVSIDYAGGLITTENNKQAMRLVGKIYYASEQQQPQIRDFRGTWTPLQNGVVQQFFEESIDGGKTWYPWFNGFYFPVNEVTERENL